MLREGTFFECTQNIFPVHWKKFSSALQKIRELTQRFFTVPSKIALGVMQQPHRLFLSSGAVKFGSAQKVTRCLTPCDPYDSGT